MLILLCYCITVFTSKKTVGTIGPASQLLSSVFNILMQQFNHLLFALPDCSPIIN